MISKGLKVAAVLATMFIQAKASAVVPQGQGRLVIFADKKTGDFKTDKSLKAGTTESINSLKMVETEKGIHACFVGAADSIKPILANMISNANKESDKEELRLKSFTGSGSQTPIEVDITSQENKSSYIRLKIDPC